MSQCEPCPKPSSHLIGCLGCRSLQGGGPKSYQLIFSWRSLGSTPSSPGSTLSSLGGLQVLAPRLTPGRPLLPSGKGQVFTVLNILHAWLEAGPPDGQAASPRWGQGPPLPTPHVLFVAGKNRVLPR